MARFSDNPTKSPLSGAEIIPATDPSTGNDIGITPVILQQFTQSAGGLASGSTNGLMTGPQSDKLNSLFNQTQFINCLNQLSGQAYPFFSGQPADGFIEIYQHVLQQPVNLNSVAAKCSAGSTNVVVMINGVAVTGLSFGISAGSTTLSNATANFQLVNNSVVGFNFTGTTGNCRNVRITLLGTEILAP
jgi:hypothetical protein